MTEELPDIGAFGAAFSEFIERMTEAARGKESPLVARIRAHLGADPTELPSTSAEFAMTDRPNLQLALDAVLPDADVLGISTTHPAFMMAGLSALLTGPGPMGGIEPGPVQYIDVEVGDGRVVRCISAGVLLARVAGAPVVLVVSGTERPFGPSVLRVDGVSAHDGVVSALLADIRSAMREHNVYRARVISLHGGDDDGPARVRFHRLPTIGREEVVLPEGTVERLERHAIGVAEHAERLRAAGRQLKRGILLHGPRGPGRR